MMEREWQKVRDAIAGLDKDSLVQVSAYVLSAAELDPLAEAAMHENIAIMLRDHERPATAEDAMTAYRAAIESNRDASNGGNAAEPLN